MIKLQVSQKSPQPSCTLKKTNDELEVPRKRYISPEERKQIIDE